MRRLVLIIAASGLLAAPTLAYGEDKTSPSKAERAEAAEREEARKCKDKRLPTKAKCKVTVPTRGETPSQGPIDRAYNAPFF